MIKFTRRPNIENLRRDLSTDRAIVNEIRHHYTNYDGVQHDVFASEDAPAIFRSFYRKVVKLDAALAPECVSQLRRHVKRLAA